MIFADLHVHTKFSDGTLSPEELVLEADKADVRCLALTDHDTVEGVDPAIEAGLACNVEVLPGVELSCEHEGMEIHLLGYLIDHKDTALLEKLKFVRKNRIERVYAMARKLKDSLDVSFDPQAVLDLANGGTVGRMHVARVMVQSGLVSSTQEAFNRYIGDTCPGFVAGFKLSPQEAIAVIKRARGVPVLAHPYTLAHDELIPRFVEMGLAGLEVYYSEHSQGMVNFYRDCARTYNLLETGGSDFHGQAKPGVKLGSIKVPYELVERLKEAQRK